MKFGVREKIHRAISGKGLLGQYVDYKYLIFLLTDYSYNMTLKYSSPAVSSNLERPRLERVYFENDPAYND